MNQDSSDQNDSTERGGEFTSENATREGEPQAQDSNPTYDYPEDDVERQIKRLRSYICREWTLLSFFKRSELIATWVGLLALIAYTGYTVAMYGTNRDAADAAASAAKTAANQLELTDRPWVTISATIDTPLIYDGKAVRATFSFIPKNIGHSPAQNVLIMPQLIPVFMGDDLRDAQDRICGGAAQINRAFPRYVLFPEEPFSEPFSLDLPVEVINSHWGKLPPNKDYPDPIPIGLVGCVDYTYATSSKHHQTGFSFDVVMKDGRLPLKSLTPLDPNLLILRQHGVFDSHFAN